MLNNQENTQVYRRKNDVSRDISIEKIKSRYVHSEIDLKNYIISLSYLFDIEKRNKVSSFLFVFRVI